MADVRLLIDRLVEQAARDAEAEDIWTAAKRRVATLPPNLLVEVAAQCIVDRYCGHISTDRPEPARYAARKKREPIQLDPELEAEISGRLHASLNRAIAIYTDAIKAEWTEDLLGETFALPSGETVTWGDATVEQHEQATRAHLDDAVRHEHAAREIRASGAPNLRVLAAAA